MKIALSSAIWTDRYRDALRPGVIKELGEIKGVPLEGLDAKPIEVACLELEAGLKAVCLVTARCCTIIQGELERALAHAESHYADPRAVLDAAYAGVSSTTAYMPTLICGLAGVGKSHFRRALERILSGKAEVSIDDSHPRIPLIDYGKCIVGSQRSVSGVLRQLASPEIASGKVRVKEAELPMECARWQRLCGTCLVGVDELQFMTQSTDASTRITETMLSIADVGVPWHCITNYSLCWKLLGRPAEATQRLLSRPALLLPDGPETTDWTELLQEYDTVAGRVFDFKLVDMARDLWNLSAGVKRELVKLLVHCYRLCRRRGASIASRSDLLKAFSSTEFFVPRRDINLLVAHAAQGGDLRRDLLCPFKGDEIESSLEQYADALRKARASKVSQAALDASLTASECEAIAGVKRALSEPDEAPRKDRQSRKAAKPMTLEALQAAGRASRERLGKVPTG